MVRKNIGAVATVVGLASLMACSPSAPAKPKPPVSPQWQATVAGQSTNVLLSSQGLPGVSAPCQAVLQGNIYDKQGYMSDMVSFRKFFDWLNESHFATSRSAISAAAELSIPLEQVAVPLGLNLSGSDTEFTQSLNRVQRLTVDEAYARVQNSGYTHTISTAMTGAFEKCVQTESDTLLNQVGAYAFGYPTNPNLTIFNVELRFRPFRLGDKATIKSVQPEEVKCTIGGKDVTGQSFADTRLVLTCRTAGTQVQALSFNTSLNSTPEINLPTRDKLAIDELRSQLGAVRSVLASLQVDVEARSRVAVADKGLIQSPQYDLSAGGQANSMLFTASCPAGQVVTGIEVLGGGTCNNMCNGNGRPVGRIKVHCGAPALAR